MSMKKELGVVYKTIEQIVQKLLRKKIKKRTDPLHRNELWNEIQEEGKKVLEKLRIPSEKGELALQEAFEEEWNEILRKRN